MGYFLKVILITGNLSMVLDLNQDRNGSDGQYKGRLTKVKDTAYFHVIMNKRRVRSAI